MAGSSGQDWASYQATDPPVAGLAFVMVKQTEGLTYINPRAASQVAHIRGAGLVAGHYHYPHMANPAAAEADRFLSVANPKPGDILALDWEGYDASNKGVPWSTMVAYKKAFIARLRAVAGTHQHLVYCSPDYLSKDPNGEYADGLWIATAGKPAGAPGIGHPWLFHQFSTAGGVDHDYCSLTPAQLKAWAHAKEVDVALTSAEIDAIALKLWGYMNTKVGDKHDMHQSLRNAEDNSAAALAGVKALAAALDKSTGTVVTAVKDTLASGVVHVDVNVTGTPTA